MDSLLATDLKPESARALLKALADPLRLRIIETLAEGERCVCDLTTDLELAQSKLSFHLRVLKDAGLLSQRLSGRWVYYRLSGAIEELRSWLGAVKQRCEKTAPPVVEPESRYVAGVAPLPWAVWFCLWSL